MSRHYRRAERPHEWSDRQRIEEAVGDGSTVTATQFAGMTAAARNHLLETNPDRYRALRDEELTR